MRGLLLTVFISVLCSYAHAQSLRVTNTPDNVFGRTASEISVNISIKNTTKKPIEVIFYRKSSEIPSGQESYFCVGKSVILRKHKLQQKPRSCALEKCMMVLKAF